MPWLGCVGSTVPMAFGMIDRHFLPLVSTPALCTHCFVRSCIACNHDKHIRFSPLLCVRRPFGKSRGCALCHAASPTTRRRSRVGSFLRQSEIPVKGQPLLPFPSPNSLFGPRQSMGSGRPAPNQVDHKPPWSPQPTQEPTMLQTTTRQKKPSDPARRVSRASILPDQSRTIRTLAPKSAQYHPSSSSEYVHKPSTTTRANHQTPYGHDTGDPRSSSSRHPESKSSKSKTPKTFDQFTSPVSPNDPLAKPYAGWLPPVGKTTDPAVRKSSKNKDKDRDKDAHRGRERDKPSDTRARKASRELSRDPYDSRQQTYHAATLGRDFKERPDENGMLPKPSGHRRHLTEDDAITLKVNRIFDLSLPISA